MQGLYGVLCFGLARLAGSVAGGYLAESSLESAMGFGAILAALATLWLVLVFHDEDACEKVQQQHAAPKRPAAATLDA